MNPYIQAIVFALLASMAHVHAAERSVTYGSLHLSSPEMQFQSQDYDEGQIRQWDMVTTMKFCAKRSGYRCVLAKEFFPLFAVPRRPLSLHDQWTLGHVTFEVHPGMRVAIPGGPMPNSAFLDQPISLLGRNVRFIVIDARSDRPDEPGTQRFLYSPEAGVIAFGRCLKPEDCNQFQWLRSEAGFCSDAFERSLPKARFLTEQEFAKAFADQTPTSPRPADEARATPAPASGSGKGTPPHN